jgi:hypothetical protein
MGKKKKGGLHAEGVNFNKVASSLGVGKKKKKR